jgi:hypothetical protein
LEHVKFKKYKMKKAIKSKTKRTASAPQMMPPSPTGGSMIPPSGSMGASGPMMKKGGMVGKAKKRK